MYSLKNYADLGTKKERLQLNNFDFANDSNIKNFIGASVDQSPSGFHLPQPHLISRILDAVVLTAEDNYGTSTKHTPTTKPLLIKDKNDEARTLPCNYWSEIGIINYLSSSIHPDI